MYYNKITKKITEHPYRFKTEQEFEEEFGEKWRWSFCYYFYPSKDKYFGEDFLMDYDEDFVEDEEDENDYCDYDGHIIVRDMLIKNNKKMLDYNKPTKLVYEKSNIELEKNICIIYKCESIEKVDELKKYFKGKIHMDISENYHEYMIITHDIVCSFNSGILNPLSGIIELWETDGYKIVMCKTIEEVKRVFKFDSKTAYNKPRELVYEKRILSFKKFNNK